jgi:hypothetical protein
LSGSRKFAALERIIMEASKEAPARVIPPPSRIATDLLLMAAASVGTGLVTALAVAAVVVLLV